MLQKLITEMPDITKKGDIVYADNKALKDLKVEDISENIVFMRQPTDSMILPKGATWVYFMDSAQSAKDMGEGKMDYIMLFSGRALGNFGQQPEFEKVFKKKAQGREHILGFMQGYSDENIIRIDFMRVRKSYRRQSINRKMLEALKDHYPNATVHYDELTKDGKKFVKGADPKSPSLKESYDYGYSSRCSYQYAYDCTAPDDYDELVFIVDNLEDEIEWDEFVEAVGMDQIEETGLLDIYKNMSLNIEDDWGVNFYKLKTYWKDEDKEIDVYVLEHSGIEHVFKKVE